jgi:hypothetical protein
MCVKKLTTATWDMQLADCDHVRLTVTYLTIATAALKGLSHQFEMG